MNAVLIIDREGASELSVDLVQCLCAILRRKSISVEVVELGACDAAPCRGCLHCLTRHPGQCVTADAVGELMHRMHVERMDSVTVYLTPVLFGHPSSVIKNALDRGTGSRMMQVLIGYGDDVDPEEESTFLDMTAKHCGAADIVHPGMVREALAFLTRSPEDSGAICAAFQERL